MHNVTNNKGNEEMGDKRQINVSMNQEYLDMLDEIYLKNLPKKEDLIKGPIAKKGYGRSDKVRAIIKLVDDLIHEVEPELKNLNMAPDEYIKDIVKEHVKKSQK